MCLWTLVVVFLGALGKVSDTVGGVMGGVGDAFKLDTLIGKFGGNLDNLLEGLDLNLIGGTASQVELK